MLNRLMIMVVAYVAMIVVNVLANKGVLNHQMTSDISNRLTVLFTPEGYVFSIWSVIYLLLAIWLILQFKNRHNEETSSTIASLFVASCMFNLLWLITWHYELFIIGQIIMFLLLGTLILIYKQYPVEDERFGGRLPFSFYLGWIAVATIANMSYTLKFYDVSLGISEPVGTVVLFIIAGLLAIVGCYVSKDPYFASVFVWAIVGIAVANSDPLVVNTAYSVALVILLAIISYSFLFNNKQSTAS